MENFRTIEINNTNVDKNILNSLFNKYPKEDIYYKIENNSIITYLSKLDFNEFRKDVKALLLNQENNGFNTSEILNALLNTIESIKSYGLKGKKRIYIGYNKERKVQNRANKEKNRGIYYYAQNNNFKKENVTLDDTKINKIICGDSENVLKSYPDNSIDLIFTSPPYNFGLEYKDSIDYHDWENYFNKLFNIFEQCIRVLKYSGRIIINVQPLFSDYIPSHHIISNYFIDKKLIWKGEIIWEKNNYNCKYTAWGSWKSPSSPYLKYTWEFIEIFAKGELTKKGDKNKIDITEEEFKKWVLAKWSISPERKMDSFKHPAMFPEELARRVIKLFSYKDDIILDPFNGVGTTTAVAKSLERKYIGIDISEEYCHAARNRIEQKLF